MYFTTSGGNHVLVVTLRERGNLFIILLTGLSGFHMKVLSSQREVLIEQQRCHITLYDINIEKWFKIIVGGGMKCKKSISQPRF